MGIDASFGFHVCNIENRIGNEINAKLSISRKYEKFTRPFCPYSESEFPHPT